jgi:hypothetical protein
MYNIEGKVAGNKAFLMILSGNSVYFTAVLEPTKDGHLAGMAWKGAIVDDPAGRPTEKDPIELQRPAKAESKP